MEEKIEQSVSPKSAEQTPIDTKEEIAQWAKDHYPWSIDDRIDRLEEIAGRLEKVCEALFLLYKEERVKNWTLILEEMLKKQDRKKGNYGYRTG